MKKELSCINLREDYAFKYVFSKDAKENRGALKCLVQYFTDCYLEEFIVENSDEKYSEDKCFITLNGKTDAGVWEKFTVCMIEKKGTFYKKFINLLDEVVNGGNRGSDEYKKFENHTVLLFLGFPCFPEYFTLRSFTYKDVHDDLYDEHTKNVKIIINELSDLRDSFLMDEYSQWIYTLNCQRDQTSHKWIAQYSENITGIYLLEEALLQISKDELDEDREKYLKEEMDYSDFFIKENWLISNDFLSKYVEYFFIGYIKGAKKVEHAAIRKLSRNYPIEEVADLIGISTERVLYVLNMEEE